TVTREGYVGERSSGSCSVGQGGAAASAAVIRKRDVGECSHTVEIVEKPGPGELSFVHRGGSARRGPVLGDGDVGEGNGCITDDAIILRTLIQNAPTLIFCYQRVGHGDCAIVPDAIVPYARPLVAADDHIIERHRPAGVGQPGALDKG